MATPAPFPGELDPGALFELHIRFRVPLWRLEPGARRIQAALDQLGLPNPVTEIVLADDVLITVTIPAGTLRDAVRGENVTATGIRHARRLTELLWDLDPVLVSSPEECP